MPRIVIGADHAGFALKEKLIAFLKKKGFTVKDAGTYSPERCDYPVFAARVGQLVSRKKYPRGILICKTGIGNSIVANRFPGVRASLCFNNEAAKLTRQHNDSNVLVLGSLFVSAREASRIVSTWLATPFEGGRHKRRVDEIKKIEQQLYR